MFIGNTNDGTVCKINDGQHPARLVRHARGLILRLPPDEHLLAEVLARLRAPPIPSVTLSETPTVVLTANDSELLAVASAVVVCLPPVSRLKI